MPVEAQLPQSTKSRIDRQKTPNWVNILLFLTLLADIQKAHRSCAALLQPIRVLELVDNSSAAIGALFVLLEVHALDFRQFKGSSGCRISHNGLHGGALPDRFLLNVTEIRTPFFVPANKYFLNTLSPKMPVSDTPYASYDHGRKRKKAQRTRDSRKKPRLSQLAEGTSHSSKPAEEAKERLRRLKRTIDSELTYENTYVYTPLRDGKGEDIRVLIIEPGKVDDPIKCRLVPSALPNNSETSKAPSYPYAALSYFWGEGNPIHEITISTYRTPTKPLKKISPKKFFSYRFVKKKPWCNTGTMHVRSNLFMALKRFRDETEERFMWIDALCIDQEDLKERTAQVKKMHELYIQASGVSIWLGDGSSEEQPNPKPCFRFLRKLLQLNGLDTLLKALAEDKSKLVEHACNIVSLMCNKWFSRRWVVQELALARPQKAKVVYGVCNNFPCSYQTIY